MISVVRSTGFHGFYFLNVEQALAVLREAEHSVRRESIEPFGVVTDLEQIVFYFINEVR